MFMKRFPPFGQLYGWYGQTMSYEQMLTGAWQWPGQNISSSQRWYSTDKASMYKAHGITTIHLYKPIFSVLDTTFFLQWAVPHRCSDSDSAFRTCIFQLFNLWKSHGRDSNKQQVSCTHRKWNYVNLQRNKSAWLLLCRIQILKKLSKQRFWISTSSKDCTTKKTHLIF